MRNVFTNVGLVLVSCAAGLALCEVSLRLFYPKYRHSAEAPFRFDEMRIWARTPNSRDWRTHPDTFVLHFLSHNNLALRQHRDFSKADLAVATNIGIFGDSFVENIDVAAPYSFTEPLDYLLNLRRQRFNVLNFGVYGYGPGQSLLHYEHFRWAKELNHVFYVYYHNDLMDLYARELFHLDETGHLVRNKVIRESWWMPLMRELHTPYLILDVSRRLSSFHAGRAANIERQRRGYDDRPRNERWEARRKDFRYGRLDHDGGKNIREIFRQLIRRWKSAVEHNGSTFSVVFFPNRPPPPFVVDLLNAEAVKVVDLWACFCDADPAHSQRPWRSSPYRFKNDDHWNEAGNRLAAACLYRALEEKTGLPRLSEGRLQEAIFRYYTAFEGEPLKAGGGGSWR